MGSGAVGLRLELSDHVAQVYEDSEDSLAGTAQDGESCIAVGQQDIVAIHENLFDI